MKSNRTHLKNYTFNLIQSDSRCIKEPFIKSIKRRNGTLILFGNRVIPDNDECDLFKQRSKRQKHDGRYQPEKAVNVGNPA